MKYYRLFNPEFDEYPSFLELDEQYYCLRKITDVAGNLINTSVQINDKFGLPEGSYADCLEYLTDEINQEAFEEIWQKSTQKYQKKWEELKSKLKIGQPILAKIICFYPQGIILDIGLKFYGIADYKACRAFFKSEKMYPQQILNLQVSGFDNVNMWVTMELIK